MKKILFSLIALVCSMSMNAQVMRIMKGNTLVAVYSEEQADNVVFEPVDNTKTGKAKRTGDIDVKWVQLWRNGPKFAEYNVGVTDGKAESTGGYYCWGSSIDQDPNNAYNKGNDVLSGNDDTATNLWGSNWRMPTQAEFQKLITYCDVVWVRQNGVLGRKFTGKGGYATNSIFLPATGMRQGGLVHGYASVGNYWTSTPHGSDDAMRYSFDSSIHEIIEGFRYNGYSIRAVLVEE